MSQSEEQQIDELLDRLKSEGRSTPAGRHWDKLYRVAISNTPELGRPGLPLILGGSGASNLDKQARLREHLIWASKYGRLPEVLAQLHETPSDGWNEGAADTWAKSFYWGEEQ